MTHILREMALGSCYGKYPCKSEREVSALFCEKNVCFLGHKRVLHSGHSNIFSLNSPSQLVYQELECPKFLVSSNLDLCNNFMIYALRFVIW